MKAHTINVGDRVNAPTLSDLREAIEDYNITNEFLRELDAKRRLTRIEIAARMEAICDQIEELREIKRMASALGVELSKVQPRIVTGCAPRSE